MFFIKARSKGKINPATLGPRVVLEREQVSHRDFSGQAGGYFGAMGCTFDDCDFSNMKLREFAFASGKKPTRYSRCKFDGSRIQYVHAGLARFESCSFLNVDITRLFTHAAEFVDCVFSGVLRESVFFGRVFENYREDTRRVVNEFSGNDFSAMRFIDVDFRQGVDLSRQRLPSGDDYLYLKDAAPKLSALRNKYLHHPASQRRSEVFQALELLEDAVRDGQADLFICRNVVDEIWAELRESAGSS